LERQRGQTLAQMLAELDTGCATGTKTNAQGYKISNFSITRGRTCHSRAGGNPETPVTP